MASIRRHPHNKSWQVRYRDPSGKPRTKTFKRQVDAKAFAGDVETDKRRGQYVDPQAGQVAFGQYAARWVATRADKAPATQDRDASYLRSMILPTFGRRPVITITASQVAQWLAELDRADATRTKSLQILRNILELARRDRALIVNPAADVKPPGTEPERDGVALTDAEVGRLLRAAEEVDETTAPLVWLMVRAGLRIGEAIALRRGDIDFSAGTITVARSMNRRGELVAVKGRKRESEGRVVPMPPDLAERMRHHLDTQNVTSINRLLVTGARGAPVRYTNWRRRQWAQTCELAEVEANPHDLRRTCATRLIRADRWSPAEVQAFLGHRDPRITLQIYTQIHAEELPTPSALSL